MPAFIEWLERHHFSLSSRTWLKWLDVLAMEQSVSQADIKLATMATGASYKALLARKHINSSEPC